MVQAARPASVADPPLGSMDYGCLVGQDSCPSGCGMDAINDFMGYMDDSSLHELVHAAGRLIMQGSSSAPSRAGRRRADRPDQTVHSTRLVRYIVSEPGVLRIQRTLTDWRTASRKHAMQISPLRSSLGAHCQSARGRRAFHCRVGSMTDSSSSQPLKVSMVGGLTPVEEEIPSQSLTRSSLARSSGVPRVSEKHGGRRGHPR